MLSSTRVGKAPCVPVTTFPGDCVLQLRTAEDAFAAVDDGEKDRAFDSH